MSDPLFCDYNECNTDVHDYARLLERPARGHVLWEPSRVGQVGDCGQIRDGQFWKFFNVYENPPPGCPCLPRLVEEDDLRVTDIDNQHVLRSAQSLSVSFHGGLPLTIPSSVSINGTFSWDRSEFAFLAFGGRTRSRKTVSPSILEDLKRYLLVHERNIRIATGVHTGDIVILHGVTRAVAWMGGVARRTSSEVNGSVSVDVGAFSVDWGISATRHRGATSTFPLSSDAACAITRGPAGWDGRDDGGLFTVVVQPVVVKRRTKMKRMLGLIKVGRWRQEAPSESPVSVSAEDHHSSPDQGQPCETVRTQAYVPGQTGSDTRQGAQGSGTEGETDMDSNAPSNSTSDDSSTDSDTLSSILEDILDRNPSLEAVVGSWDIISDFALIYGSIPSAGEVKARLRVDAQDTDVAFVVALVPQGVGFQRGSLSSNEASSPASVISPSALSMDSVQFSHSSARLTSMQETRQLMSLRRTRRARLAALRLTVQELESVFLRNSPAFRATSEILRDIEGFIAHEEELHTPLMHTSIVLQELLEEVRHSAPPRASAQRPIFPLYLLFLSVVVFAISLFLFFLPHSSVLGKVENGFAAFGLPIRGMLFAILGR